MKSATKSLRKAPKSLNFDFFHAFSVCRGCANIWFQTRYKLYFEMYSNCEQKF